MVREGLQDLSEAAVASASLSGVAAKPYLYNGKTSCDVYCMQFANMAPMNNWSNEKKFCVLTAAETLQQLFWKIFSRRST
nr:unnamed protein product [Callosobruchus chinensis]